ncbi:hypothetical protein [Mycobacterium tilburgii]|uniref:hypothetical protein n=1 Tax=Mycobacterium tilburgii TaxID=44467 RepID=UPI0021B483BE|nr:hypothetical protein [Mycobacterium tilburgii]
MTSPAGPHLRDHAGQRPAVSQPVPGHRGPCCPEAKPPQDYCGERTAMMPRRRRTRAQDRSTRVAAERRQNWAARLVTRAARTGPAAPPETDAESPPS